MNDTTETERKIAERIDPAAAGAVVLSQKTGGLALRHMEDAMQFSKFMAISGIAVRKHLRGNPGTCLAVITQAVEWRMSPFAVANKTYEVNGQLAYESQLIQAVVLQRAPIKGPFDVAYSGEGERRQCRVTAHLRDGGDRSYTSPEIGRIPIKNSPLWKNDPDQQLFYYSGRALCRRFFPDVLLGIYTPDELYEDRRGPEHARDITPARAIVGAPHGESQKAITTEPTEPPHDPETGEVITEEMASQAQAKSRGATLSDARAQEKAATDEALNDPSGRKAAMELAMQLEERGKRVMGLT